MNKKILIIVGILIVIACQPKIDSHEHDHAHADDHHDEIELTSIQAKNIGIQYEKVMDRNLVSSFQLPGRVELPPNGKSLVSSHLAGNVTNIYIEPGQTIRKGQRIARITNLEIVEWQEQFQSNMVELDFLNKELSRQEALKSSQISIQKNIDQVKADIEAIQIRQKALEIKLSLLGITNPEEQQTIQSAFFVLAPMTGLVEKVMVNNGSHIEAQSSIVQIIDPGQLFIHFTAFEKDINKLKKGQLIEFSPPGNPEASGTAEVEWISAIVEEHSNAYGIHAKITSPKNHLSIGQYVEGAFINRALSVPSLPVSALTQDKGLDFIFAYINTEGDHHHFQKIRVRTGVQHNGYFEVLPIDEIPDDAAIVVNGAYFLMSESRLGEMEAGHSH